MNLLLFNLATDADDTVLGFTTDWLTTLSRYFSNIHVITMRRGRFELPANVSVHSIGKERGWNRPRRTVEFYRCLFKVLRSHRIDVCFAHMIPIFAVLAAPVLKAKRIPIVIWYAHSTLNNTLRLAHWFSSKVVTSIDFAYPYKQDKVVTIGQGIDTNFFAPSADQSVPHSPRLIVAVGRISQIKRIRILVSVARVLNTRRPGSLRVVLIGGPSTTADTIYLEQLKEAVASQDLIAVVQFAGPKPRHELLGWYRSATVLVNLTGRGCGDKVVLEAMSCGTPVIVANEGFRTTLGTCAKRFVLADLQAETVAAAIENTCSLSQRERTDIGRYMREQVIALHSIDGLASRLHSVCKGLLNESA